MEGDDKRGDLGSWAFGRDPRSYMTHEKKSLADCSVQSTVTRQVALQ